MWIVKEWIQKWLHGGDSTLPLPYSPKELCKEGSSEFKDYVFKSLSSLQYPNGLN